MWTLLICRESQYSLHFDGFGYFQKFSSIEIIGIKKLHEIILTLLVKSSVFKKDLYYNFDTNIAP